MLIFRVLLELFKGIFFIGFQFRMEKKLPDALRTANCNVSSFKRLCTTFFVKIGFLTLSTPLLPGLKSAISKVVS